MGVIAAVTIASLVAIASGCAVVGGALVGLIFRGAAVAWREERDAAVEKAERLEDTVHDQQSKIARLEQKVEELEKRTDYEAYAKRSAREHRQILDTLVEQGRLLHANTTALEFLIKQIFPTPTVNLATGGEQT